MPIVKGPQQVFINGKYLGTTMPQELSKPQAYRDGFHAFSIGAKAECDRTRTPAYRRQWYDGWYDAYFSSKFSWWFDG